MYDTPGLFPAPAGSAPSLRSAVDAPVLAVGELVASVNRVLGPVLGSCWVSGEVSNCSRSSAGHVYFTLKDDEGQIRCVLFAREAAAFPEPLNDGMRIEVRGALGVYVRGGDLQIRVREWRRTGVGALYEAYLELKRRLSLEGLFSAERKRPLPFFVRRLAIVSSKQAAGFQDVVRTLRRRMPWLRVRLFHALVQGEAAPESLVSALERADLFEPDVILLVRGGGSFEDLFCFNDERLVRAVAATRAPVVAGIGHETDETLASLAADLNCSTPTAAAEQCGRPLGEWLGLLAHHEDQLTRACERAWESRAMALDNAERFLGSADRVLSAPGERLERLGEACHRSMEMILESKGAALRRASQLVPGVEVRVASAESSLATLASRLDASVDEGLRRGGERLAADGRGLEWALRRLDQLEERLGAKSLALAALDPERPLAQGYAMLSTRGGVLASALSLKPGDAFEVRTRDAVLGAVVETVSPREKVTN